MSTETLPISPARFAEAIKDLSVASLHLKTLEIRNSLAHLAYSNAQLQPFADGTQTSHDGTPGQPDPDCVEAIRENEVVMGRMRGRIELIRAEVEGRGLSWTEFEGKDEVEDDEPGVVAPAPGATNGGGSAPLANGVNGHAADAGDDTAGDTTGTASSGRNPWTDGTFQTGVIRNGEVHMHAVPGQRSGSGTATATAAGSGQGTTSGGRLSDEELRRMLEVRLAEDGGDEEGGMHL
ncbi:hypothetical protein VM1G_01413 [Cytospora mali]|uniref:Translation machinery-associated protein 17 n=1 Tax=Cytospora mali TaxID=578113 RepID=A0A194VQB1_CYTMA|nr:hypothetical protein VM1G_01413 [Valsa mali]